MSKFKQVEITEEAFTTLVNEGKKLDEICEHFKDADGNNMKASEAKKILKDLGLRIKKTSVPKFKIIRKEETTNNVVEPNIVEPSLEESPTSN